MPFLQAERACLLLTDQELPELRRALRRLGYRRHRGLRSRRPGEIDAWVAPLDGVDQIHVQCAVGRCRFVEVFAHTEPEGHGLAHGISALLDGADFRRGARQLLRDLRHEGWQVERYQPRL